MQPWSVQKWGVKGARSAVAWWVMYDAGEEVRARGDSQDSSIAMCSQGSFSAWVQDSNAYRSLVPARAWNTFISVSHKVYSAFWCCSSLVTGSSAFPLTSAVTGQTQRSVLVSLLLLQQPVFVQTIPAGRYGNTAVLPALPSQTPRSQLWSFEGILCIDLRGEDCFAITLNTLKA